MTTTQGKPPGMGYLHRVSTQRIAPPAVTGSVAAADLIDQAFLSYNAGRLREACQVFTRKMLEPDCTVGLTLSGALTPGRARHVLPDPAGRGRVHRLDRHHRRQPLPRHPLRPRHGAAPEPARPRRPRAARSTRSSASTTSSSTTRTCSAPTRFYRELIRDEAFQQTMGTAEFHYLVGKYLHARAAALGRPANSLLAAAYEAGVPIFTSSPGDSSIGMNLAALSLAGRQAPHRPAARREPDGGHRLRREARRRQVGRLDPRRRQPEELHAADRAADSGSARPGRERPRLLPAGHRRPPRHRRPLGRDAQRGDDLGQGRSRQAARLGDLLHRHHDRPAAR